MSRHVADPLMAMCAFLREQIGDLVTVTPGDIKGIPAGVPAIFRPDMPAAFDAVMPTESVVLRPAGGYTRFGTTQILLGDPRVDVLAYGKTQQSATMVCRAVIVACKFLVVQEWENVLLMSAQCSGGPLPLPDTQTLWPTCWCSLQVTHGELPVA